jgi:ornithine decarboxylase
MNETTGKTLEELRQTLPQSIPIYKFRLSQLESIVINWKENLPRVVPYYALKAFKHEKMVKKMAVLGCHFDCASIGEIEMVKSLCHQDIIYANTVRPYDHLEYAAKAGIELYTFDSVIEALRILEVCPKAKLVLRVSIDNPHSGCNFGEKFGVLEEDVDHFLQEFKEKNLTIYGLSFHVGSGNTDPTIFDLAIQKSYDISQKLLSIENHPPIRLLDIGGGFINDEKFPEICRGINAALQEYFPDTSDRDKLKIIAEPGRYFAGSLMTAEFTIIGKRMRQGRLCYSINDSIYGVFYCVMNNYTIYTEKDIRLPFHAENSEAKKHLSVIFGQSCDSGDVIARDILLPELQIGDKVEFLDMGAYGVDICSEFNGFKNGVSIFLDE